MTIDERTKKIQAELEVCKQRADFCIKSHILYTDEASEIYFKLIDISFQDDISEKLKAKVSEIAEHLSTKYGNICV